MILYENLGFGVRTQDAEIFKKRGSYDMIPHGKEIKVFTGSSNPDLADMICKNLGISLGKSTVTAFADGECSISINEPVRGVDVFIVQSTCKPVNDSLMELLVMIDAMKRASAGRITAVIPYFGYARQDRKAKARDPISAKLVANLLTVAGADRVLTMDLHAAQIQGFFDIPVDNLYGAPLFATHYLRRFGYGREDMVVVSPDVGSVARARSFAMKMGLGLAIVDKRREKANSSEVMNIIGNVEGKTCLLLDDMVDTAGSLCGAAKAIVEVGGAKEVYACASHGVLSGPAIDRINEAAERRNKRPRHAVHGILVEGLDNCLIKFSRCCTPVPGDSIIGFITRGAGVSIHRTDCENYLASRDNPETAGRWIRVSWAERTTDAYSTTLMMLSAQRSGLVMDVATALNTLNAKVRTLTARDVDSGRPSRSPSRCTTWLSCARSSAA